MLITGSEQQSQAGHRRFRMSEGSKFDEISDARMKRLAATMAPPKQSACWDCQKLNGHANGKMIRCSSSARPRCIFSLEAQRGLSPVQRTKGPGDERLSPSGAAVEASNAGRPWPFGTCISIARIGRKRWGGPKPQRAKDGTGEGPSLDLARFAAFSPGEICCFVSSGGSFHGSRCARAVPGLELVVNDASRMCRTPSASGTAPCSSRSAKARRPFDRATRAESESCAPATAAVRRPRGRSLRRPGRCDGRETGR